MAKILIVDDDRKVRQLTVALLGINHTILEANNGQEGLRMFTKHRPDLVITDLNMPFMTGLELINNLRVLHKVKIIVYSAFLYTPEQQAAILQAGANLCLAKPAELATLKKAVDELLAPPAQQSV
ncbi:MAG: response regulator [Acidobacteriota bacterium]